MIRKIIMITKYTVQCTLNPHDTHVTHDANHVHVAYDAQYDNNAFNVDDAHDT